VPILNKRHLLCELQSKASAKAGIWWMLLRKMVPDFVMGLTALRWINAAENKDARQHGARSRRIGVENVPTGIL
jgi:hypothetical protein